MFKCYKTRIVRLMISIFFLISSFLLISCRTQEYVPPKYTPMPSSGGASSGTGSLVLRYGRCKSPLCKGDVEIYINDKRAFDFDWDTGRALEYCPVPPGGYTLRVQYDCWYDAGRYRSKGHPTWRMDGEPGTVDLLMITHDGPAVKYGVRKLTGTAASRLLEQVRSGRTNFFEFWEKAQPY